MIIFLPTVIWFQVTISAIRKYSYDYTLTLTNEPAAVSNNP